MRIAVDVGGTFTDVIVLDEKTNTLRLEKVETTPQDPAAGVLQSFHKANARLSDINYFVHGTTLGLNALLTRTSTAVMDAYIKPVIRSYLEKLDGGLRRGGFTGHFLLTRSGGGAMTVASATEQPVHSVLSGPAGGVIGARSLSQLIGHANLITLDMGGTSLDASLVVDGQITIEHEASFEGLPISIPTIDIKTIGAGGGSIGWIDDGGHLQVGPQSAGAVPGPACYGKGGQQPTFTDAALIVGYLDSHNFLGGEIKLDPALARQALQQKLAQPLRLSLPQTAAGILRISEAKITGALREISVERGFHPKDFALLAFGGGGGFVASGVARELGAPTVIVPPGPANFSAFGMLMVNVVHDFARTYVTELDNADVSAISSIYAGLVERGQEALRRDGFLAKAQTFLCSAELRYQGQEHTVNVPVPGRDLTASDIAHIAGDFNAAHLAQYGHHMNDPIEIVTLRVSAVGLLPRPLLPTIAAGTGGSERARKGSRSAYQPALDTAVNYAVYDRGRLLCGDRIDGPAIIEEPSSTTVLHGGDVVTVGQYGELVIEVGKR